MLMLMLCCCAQHTHTRTALQRQHYAMLSNAWEQVEQWREYDHHQPTPMKFKCMKHEKHGKHTKHTHHTYSEEMPPTYKRQKRLYWNKGNGNQRRMSNHGRKKFIELQARFRRSTSNKWFLILRYKNQFNFLCSSLYVQIQNFRPILVFFFHFRFVKNLLFCVNVVVYNFSSVFMRSIQFLWF